jgi:predicted nucleic acid-binding protein
MIVLADTSVWVDHFRRGDPELVRLLERGEIVMHPFIIGELMLGNASSIAHVVEDMQALPKANVASTDEILLFIADRKLPGTGIGYVDAHLLGACALTPETLLWTRDKRLHSVARLLLLAAEIRN